MSAEDRQSQLAREHKERQAKRAEQAAKSKRNATLGAVAAVVVVVAGLVVAMTLVTRGDDGDTGKTAASGSPTPTASASVPALTPPSPAELAKKTCEYRKDTSGSPAKKVGMPPAKPDLKAKTMTITTNHGVVVIDLLTELAPCSVNSMAFLAKKNFYDDTRCHRLATPENSGVGLIQCGDPQAKADGKNPTDGQGSSGYVFDDESLETAQYTKGVVALAQPVDASNQNGSQFWISMADETNQIDKAYTPFGVVSKGMDVLEKIYNGGWITNPDDITGDGGSTAPKIPLIIKDVRIS
ncbi:peptidyl-prolyl cis-trans isomerase B (cyclophilin B) [Streptosporangium becharense]|uniref:Peptidyl-prolyl cis-trans isomerase B (Cyclophilin B) n=1 Tax=Streptosporangium becharense TaxID=1816182 RepID=A0A7W9MEQ4_9ACTN|nr:peptidylprolyl isomerase [Streptosporangium becharense]MBB2914986.1 peptidyl-prolyl cis-trans isomerase B (cyclophilin B) [Streptosporangium becharense]MBB5818035.1 peptidyl-prolyl cis-trans isomerase B (cyclophilin B) [Streptosporangium becharense]